MVRHFGAAHHFSAVGLSSASPLLGNGHHYQDAMAPAGWTLAPATQFFFGETRYTSRLRPHHDT
jgi:hypothetical protein